MKVDITDVGPCKKKLVIAVAKERIAEELDKQYGDLIATTTLKGFRRGKAPRKLVEKLYGKHIEEEIRDSLTQESLEQALSENELDPVGRPNMENVNWDVSADTPLSFEVVLEVKPSFELPDLGTIKVEKKAIEVSDAELTEEIQGLLQQNKVFEPISEGQAEVGDQLVADIELVSADGDSLFEDEDVLLVAGSDEIESSKLPGVGEKLVGLEKGQQTTIGFTAPEDFPEEELRGQELALKVNVHEVKRSTVPELDDEFAKENGFDSATELREKIRSDMLSHRETKASDELFETVMDQIITACSFDLPQDLLENERRMREHTKRYELKQAGQSDEEIDGSFDALSGEIAREAERTLKVGFIMDRVSNQAKLFITEDEILSYIENVFAFALKGENPPTLRQLYDMLEERGELAGVRNMLMSRKIWDHVLKQVEIQETV